MAVENVFGGSVAWHSEFDKNAAKIGAHHWPEVPNLGDLTQIDWSAIEPVDILTAGYPCQPFSVAGKRNGLDDSRHIWPHIAEGIGVLRPRYVVLENVRGHLSLGGKEVLQELARVGYDARWGVVRASDAGAPHQRARLFIVATDAKGERLDGTGEAWVRWAGPSNFGSSSLANSDSGERNGREQDTLGQQIKRDAVAGASVVAWGEYEPAIRRWERVLGRPVPSPTCIGISDQPRLCSRFTEWMMGLPEGHVTSVPGLAHTAQIKACGNGVVPQQAELALRILLSL